MGRPRLIIIIRHAQSEGNKNREIHQSIPDHRVKLTADGWAQAYDAGKRLRSMLRDDDTLQFFTSPYRRTRETTEGILATLTSEEPESSPFNRNNIKVYEEPRLREQDFGNFQPCSAEMERMWQERADYGHFFYRIPDGESAADAYDRVSGFNESLWRQFGDDDFPSVCVLVTHGLMSRVFLMKWYHFSVEYFEDLRNVNHCEFLIMRKEEENGKYALENKLRTWSELRRERASLKAKENEEADKEGKAAPPKLDRQNSSSMVQRRWGGCPDGCNHSKHFKIRRDLAELRQQDEHGAAKSCVTVEQQRTPTKSCVTVANGNVTLAARRSVLKRLGPNNSDEDSDDPRGIPEIDVTKAREDIVSSPDGTPSFITIDDRLRAHLKSPHTTKPSFLHVGRDFGGTHSGHGSDAEMSEDDAKRRLAEIAARVKGGNTHGNVNTNGNGPLSSKDVAGKSEKYLAESGMGRGVHANRLGDAPASCSDQGSDGGDERDDREEADDDLAKEEREDKSLRGSVY